MNDRIPGSSWSNPIWHGKWRIYVSGHGMFNYEFVHDDYDGADDSNDGRCGYGKSVEECKHEIDLREEENA